MHDSKIWEAYDYRKNFLILLVCLVDQFYLERWHSNHEAKTSVDINEWSQFVCLNTQTPQTDVKHWNLTINLELFL